MQCRKCFLKGPTVLFLKTGRFIGNYTLPCLVLLICPPIAKHKHEFVVVIAIVSGGEDIFHRHPTPRRTAKISCHKYMNKLGMNSDFVYRKKGCNCNHKWSLDRSTKFRTLPHPVELLNFLKLSLT